MNLKKKKDDFKLKMIFEESKELKIINMLKSKSI